MVKFSNEIISKPQSKQAETYEHEKTCIKKGFWKLHNVHIGHTTYLL